MTTYFFISGILLNIALAGLLLLCVWVWFIWPAVEAASITRCFRRASKASGGNPSLKDTFRTFSMWYVDLLFGRNWTRISNRQFEWEGVGNWHVYTHDE